jgi:hypothetical protein
MSELIPKPKPIAGRKRNVTAKAWIVWRKATRDFVSKVSLGQGRIYERVTETGVRQKALDFNRAHLMELLNKRSGAPPVAELQLELLESPVAAKSA